MRESRQTHFDPSPAALTGANTTPDRVRPSTQPRGDHRRGARL